MRFTRISLGALTLLLLIVVPVSAAPALQKSSQTSYDLSVSISFLQSCQPILVSALSPGIVCPMIDMISPSLNINGTLGWIVTNLNATTADLNVTRDITTSSGEIIAPSTHHAGSFNESINLATRIATILPFIEPEMDQALQMAQTNMGTSVATGADWSSTMSTIDVTMMRQPLHTMWWVNGPLRVNDTVPVLVFPTNVTGSTTVNVGGIIGSRSAWTLAFINTRSLLPPDPLASMTSSIPVADNFEFALTFNYDQTSDLLLNATADIHIGFDEQTFIEPTACDSSATTAPATTVCPASPVPILREFGIEVQASLKLISTTLDLTQRLTPTGSSDSNSGSSLGGGSGTSPGPLAGLGSGSGPSSSSGPNSSPGSGYNPGSGSTTTGAGQPTSNPAQSKPATQSAGLLPWIFGILGIIASAIIASGVWIARRRMRRNRSVARPPQQAI
jgi:hypothetical protein